MDEILGDDGVLSVAENTLELTLGGGLDGLADLGVGGGLLEADGEIDDGDIDGGDTESHTSELAVEGRNDLTDGLGSTGGGRNDVGRSRSASSPVLSALAGTIDGELGGGGGVDGGHETLNDAKVVVDDLGERSETVGGAGSVGDDVVLGLVVLVVDAHDEHGGVVLRGSGHDDLLGASGEVSGSLGLVEEAAGGLADVVGADGAPRDLGGVSLSEDDDLVAIDDELAVLSLDGSGVSAVDRVVLELVDHVVEGHEGVVDGDNLDLGVSAAGAADESANTTETIDTNTSGGRHCNLQEKRVKKL